MGSRPGSHDADAPPPPDAAPPAGAVAPGAAAPDPEPRPVCATCGAVPADEDAAALARITWARGSENGRDVWTCDVCSRRHLRSIEGKLDSAWW